MDGSHLLGIYVHLRLRQPNCACCPYPGPRTNRQFSKEGNKTNATALIHSVRCLFGRVRYLTRNWVYYSDCVLLYNSFPQNLTGQFLLVPTRIAWGSRLRNYLRLDITPLFNKTSSLRFHLVLEKWLLHQGSAFPGRENWPSYYFTLSVDWLSRFLCLSSYSSPHLSFEKLKYQKQTWIQRCVLKRKGRKSCAQCTYVCWYLLCTNAHPLLSVSQT